MMARPCCGTLQEREACLDAIDKHGRASANEYVRHPSSRERVDGQASTDRDEEEHGLQTGLVDLPPVPAPRVVAGLPEVSRCPEGSSSHDPSRRLACWKSSSPMVSRVR
jgi:hypothetical protein